MTHQRVYVYKARGGALVSFTKPQQDALQRAGKWSETRYTILSVESGKPSHSDAEIVELLGKYPKMTHVGVLHPEYRPVDFLFGVRNPRRYEPDAATMTFARAMECASQQFGCDVVTISERDCTHGFHDFAADWKIILLVV